MFAAAPNVWVAIAAHSVIAAFFDVYNKLGYGFLEAVYTMALERELLKQLDDVSEPAVLPKGGPSVFDWLRDRLFG